MAPRTKAAQQATADESEDDLQLATTADDAGTTRKTTMAKAKATTRGASATKTATKRKAPPKQPREALKDRTNIPEGNEADEVDAFDDEDMTADGNPKAKRAKMTKAVARKKADTETDEPKKAPAKRARQTKRAPSPEPLVTIPETQQDPEFLEDVEQSVEIDPENMDIEKERTPDQPKKFYQRAPSVPVQTLQPRASARSVIRAGSAQPTFSRARSGSANGAERRGGDPELRRQLNDMTKMYENLQLKYESLEDVGKSQANSNFERLKRASDQKAKDANELIASLKKELAELKKTTTSSSSESTSLQKQVAALTASNERLTAERDDFKSKLHVSQNETKALEAKLVQARQQVSASVQEAKANERKFNSSVPGNLGEAQKEAKMKENLYADLTGLIIRGVKQRESEDEYDCIQTGRNGTLHFHLSIANETAAHLKTPSGLSYEEEEFAYEPLLDESRDRELLDLLPDYLTEEICFPRHHAQRFYSKVVDSMTKKIVVEEDE